MLKAFFPTTPAASITGLSTDGKTVTGSAPAGAPIYLRKNGSLIATLLASVAGVWSYTFPQTVFTNDVLDAATTVTTLAVPLQPISITGAPNAAPLNVGYSWTPTIYNGSGSRTFSLSGTLPTGLSFSSSTGTISGTATVASTQSICITVTDSTGSYTLTTSITASAAALPAGGLGEWRFSEGSGTTVADAIGSNPINLALPTNPNYTWNSKGVSLANGLVQTPSIAGCRSRAMLYWVDRGETSGFILSGGSASGAGILGPVAPKGSAAGAACLVCVASGNGVRPLYVRIDQSGTSAQGFGANILNRGNWVLVFEDFGATFTTAHGLLGRYGTTTSRCASGGIGWFYTSSAAWSDADRANIAAYVRAFIAKPRGIYIDWSDCPTIVSAIGISGQSNADGRALNSDLSSADQALTYADVKILAANSGSTSTYPPAQLALGTNQQQTSPSTQFGPEIGMAMRHEALHAGTPLWMSKTAQGSTFGVPSSLGNGVTSSNTWHPDEFATGSLFGALLTWRFDLEATALNAGIGLQFVAWFHMQGEQDATNTIFSNVYQPALQRFYDQLQFYTNDSGIRFVVGQIAGHDPSQNNTAAAQVQAAQAAFVAANSNARLIVTSNTTTYPLKADNVHYNGAGQKTLGQTVYDVAMAA